jgi:hypothetical protein
VGVTFRHRRVRPLATAAVLVLAVMLASAQPAASLAWLAGAHATPLQAAFHDEAVEHGHAGHHGPPASAPHGHGTACETCTGDAGALTTGPVFAPVQVHEGFFQDAMKATVGTIPESPAPTGERRGAPLAESAPAEHFPSVPHRPPISSPGA